MPKSDEYECPRCNYKTKIKRNIYRHFFEKKTFCTNINNLDLTDEIKEYVLEHRIYHKMKPLTETGMINNFNVLNNYVSGLDTFEKLPLYLTHISSFLMDINDKGEKQHEMAVKKIENDRAKYPILIESHKFLEMIDSLVGVEKNKITEMNVLYDEELNKIRIWCDNEWESYLPDEGMKRLVQILRTNYLDKYECYLYKKIYVDKRIGAYQLNEVRLKLEDYYKFLYTLGHHPYVYIEESKYVLENYKHDNPDELCNYGMSIYDDVKKNVSKTEINVFKKTVLDIIKRNHKRNTKNLNENILDLINVDSEFKNKIMKPSQKLPVPFQ